MRHGLLPSLQHRRRKRRIPDAPHEVYIHVGEACAATDPRHAWRRIREFGDEGALLVRPDQIVAWRAMEGVADPLRELRAALRVVLRRTPALNETEHHA